MFINDIDLVLRMIEIVKKFADDAKLGGKAETAAQRRSMQDALDSVKQWADTWGMQFNVKKCKVLHLGHNNSRQVYTMAGQALVETKVERDVGVMVSESLRPSEQCARAARTANVVLGQITRAFQYRDRHVFMRLYKQYVLPHLEFAVQAWSPWTAADKEILEKVQRRAVGMVAGLAARSYETRLEELGMLTLEERRHQSDMVQTFKMIRGFDAVDPGQWFDHVNSSERMTRGVADPLNLKQKRARLELRRNFFSLRVVEHWNKVPYDLKRVNSVKAFKSGYKQFRKGLVTNA